MTLQDPLCEPAFLPYFNKVGAQKSIPLPHRKADPRTIFDLFGTSIIAYRPGDVNTCAKKNYLTGQSYPAGQDVDIWSGYPGNGNLDQLVIH